MLFSSCHRPHVRAAAARVARLLSVGLLALLVHLVHPARVPLAAPPADGPATSESPATGPPAIESPANESPEVEAVRLVKQLGDVEFTVRERATSRLIDLGLAAENALAEGSEHPDREIRYRSQRILATVREQDFESRLKAFLSDLGGTRDYNLPGWKEYREFAGDDQHVRELFVEMQRSEPQLLAAVARGGKPTSEALLKRVQAIQQAMQVNRNRLVIDIGTVATLLFAALDEDVSVSPLASQTISNFLYQPSFNNAIHAGGGRPVVLRRMLAEWISRRTDDVNVYQSMMLALRYEVKEGIVPAARVLRESASQMNQPNNAHLRQYGLLTFARFGDEQHIPLVEPLLEDKTPYGGQRRINNVTYRTQVRDIALATLVELAGQKHGDYGFANLQKHPQYVFNASTLAFANDKDREKAIEKWRAYRKTRGAEVSNSADPAPAEDADPPAGKQDADKQDGEKQGAGKQDADKQDAGKQDAGKQDAGKQDAENSDADETAPKTEKK